MLLQVIFVQMGCAAVRITFVLSIAPPDGSAVFTIRIQWLRRRSQKIILIEFCRGDGNIQTENTGVDTLNALLALVAFLSVGIGGYNQIASLPESLDGFGVGKPGTLQSRLLSIGNELIRLRGKIMPDVYPAKS